MKIRGFNVPMWIAVSGGSMLLIDILTPAKEIPTVVMGLIFGFAVTLAATAEKRATP